ncbi:MAG: hypothetical protein AAGA00_16705 [Pseudomonadota bacterium]
MLNRFDETEMRAALLESWSLQTAKQWTQETPAAGQCNVTAVVVHDLFGGDILKTDLPGYDVDHFYNRIDGVVVDLTDGQFSAPVTYDDEPASREEAMQCVLASEYDTLRAALLARLKQQ